MKYSIDKATRDEMYGLVCKEAEKVGYLTQGRPENSQFMERLVSNPEIGGRLTEHMEKEKVKTYIKDAILNAYAKEKKRSSLSSIDPEKAIAEKFSAKAVSIETDGANQVTLYRTEGSNRQYIAVASGTYLKWETALRKALICLGKWPCTNTHPNATHILLLLSTNGKTVTEADSAKLESALAFVKAKAKLTR